MVSDEYPGDAEDESFHKYGDDWHINLLEGVEYDHADAEFSISGYEWFWDCGNCGATHEDFNSAKPVTDGETLTCLRCGAEHSVEVTITEGSQ